MRHRDIHLGELHPPDVVPNHRAYLISRSIINLGKFVCEAGESLGFRRCWESKACWLSSSEKTTFPAHVETVVWFLLDVWPHEWLTESLAVLNLTSTSQKLQGIRADRFTDQRWTTADAVFSWIPPSLGVFSSALIIFKIFQELNIWCLSRT